MAKPKLLRSAMSLLLVYLLLACLAGPLVPALAAGQKEAFQSSWTSDYDAGDITIVAELPDNTWKEGKTVNITVTISGSWITTYRRSGGVPGARILLEGGKAEVVAVDPPLEVPEDTSMWDVDYQGQPIRTGSDGSISSTSSYCLVEWARKVFYPSGTTFTATLCLGKRTIDRPQIVASHCKGAGSGVFLYFETVDRIEGTVYDIWTNIPQAAHMRDNPMSGVNVQLYSLPDRKLVAEATTGASGTYLIESDKLDPKQRYLLRAATKVEGKELKQERNITAPQRVDIYLPATLVKNYLTLVDRLDSIELPSLSDVDLMLGLGYGGPLKETSVYGPLAELANLGIQINETQSLQTRLKDYLDRILSDAPPCQSLVKGGVPPDNPWNKLLRVTLVLGFLSNRVDDAYISIDNVVKGLTVAVMTTLMMDRITATANTKLSTLDKLTPKRVRAAQEWLMKKGNEAMKKAVGVTHVAIFAGAFGMGGMDWLLEKCGIHDPDTKNSWKAAVAKVIRFGITDLLRRNFGTSLIFEVIFQGARTIGDVALLEFYLWLTRGELKDELWAANNIQPLNQPSEAANAISVMDTEHEDWHKAQHNWAISWFKAANLFRGVGGAYDIITAKSGIQYPFIWESLGKRFMKLNPWLKAAGIGSFAGVIITELRALYVTWERQLDAVYVSFGEESPFAKKQRLGSPADPLSLSTNAQVQEYVDAISRLKSLIETGDRDATAAAVDDLQQSDEPVSSELENMFLRLTATHPQALYEVEGFDTTYSTAVDAYTQALAEQTDLYISLAHWLRNEETDLQQLLTSIDTTQQAVQKAWSTLTQALQTVENVNVPAFLFLSPKIPERIPANETIQVSLLVKNLGDQPAHNVKATISVDNTLSIRSDPTMVIGQIAAGSSAEAKWTITTGTGQAGDVGTLWFTAEGENLEAPQASGAILVTLGNQSQLEILAHSPVQLVVSDGLGHRVGYDPETGGTAIEIPGAQYSGPETSPQRIVIPDPIGLYQVDLLGTGEGTYHLEIKALQNGQLVAVQTSEGTARKGEWSTILVPVVPTNGTLTLPYGQSVEPEKERSSLLVVFAALACVVVAAAASLPLLRRKRTAKTVTGTHEKPS